MSRPGVGADGEGSLGIVFHVMVGSVGMWWGWLDCHGVNWHVVGSARMSHGGSCAAPATWLSQGSVSKFAEGKLIQRMNLLIY